MGNLPATASASSTAKRPVLADSWIERLFQKFEDFYGTKWAAQYGAFPRERVKRTWAEELGGFATKPEAIAAALDAQKANQYPPTLPEFLAACREAAKRVGEPKPPALEHKLSPEEIERNRDRAKALAEQLARKITAATKTDEAVN